MLTDLFHFFFFQKQKSFPSQEKHQERRKLLFDLTQDVHIFSSRAKILDQLAQSISATINADSYTLYLVNKSGTVSDIWMQDTYG